MKKNLVFFSRLKRHMEIKKALREGLPLPKGREYLNKLNE